MAVRPGLYPYSFTEADNGLIYLSNGMGAVRRWDGLGTTLAERAGLAAPTSAIAMGEGFTGEPATFGIVGKYTVYFRYKDRFGGFSNLSPISTEVDFYRLSGQIEAVSPGAPITITTPVAHGLTSLETVYIQGCALLAANGLWQIINTGATTFTLLNSSAPAARFTYPGGGTWRSGVRSIVYSGLPLPPPDPKVTGWQILRNTQGQTDVYYVDIDSTNLSAGQNPISARHDTETVNTVEPLSVQEAVPLFGSDGKAFANRHGLPRNDKPVMASYLDRLYAAGSLEFAQGGAAVTNGSATVTGIGFPFFPPALIGRLFYVNNHNKTYQIIDVPSPEFLTLSEAYTGATDAYVEYGVRPAPVEARKIYWSEAGLPESWPPTNALTIPVDGDEITGLMPKASFLYILERRHIYRLTAQEDPGLDGYIFLTARRGCVNNRCWVLVDDVAYMLDEEGVHAFTGQSPTPISAPVQSLFRQNADSLYRIHWAARDQFHAVQDSANEVIRWFVCLGGGQQPRHALCYDYRRQRWWIEEYPVPIGASCQGRLGNTAQVYLGADARRVLAPGYNTLDGVEAGANTIRGTVTSATIRSLTDSTAAFLTDGSLAGHPVTIVKGKGRGQQRLVTAASATVLKVKDPWTILPDSTSTYQIGGIRWRYQTKWLHLRKDDQASPTRVALLFKPTKEDATADLKLYEDLAEEAVEWGVDETSADGNGIETVKGRDYRTVDLTKANGKVHARFDRAIETFSDAPEWVRVELAGVSNADRVRIKQILFEGADG